MADKLMYIHIDDIQITPSVDYNQWLKRLDCQLNEPTIQDSLESPKLLSQQIKKHYKTLGTSVIMIPMSSPTHSH